MWLNNINQQQLILASQSPRRQELLRMMGVNFEVKVKPIDEVFPDNLAPEKVAEYLSQLKSTAFNTEIKEGYTVITSDTTVYIDHQILNKPENEADAKRMISLLSGKTHSVFTGITIKNKHTEISFTDEAQVTFETLSESEIDYYIKNHKPFDKAGAYGIQEWIGLVGINTIKGSYFTVMGLPTHRLRHYFKSMF